MVFKGFDPTTDPAYLANYNYFTGMNELGSQYWQEHDSTQYAYGYTVGQVVPSDGLDTVDHALPATAEGLPTERAGDAFDSENLIDSKWSTGIDESIGEYAFEKIRNFNINSEPNTVRKQLSLPSCQVLGEVQMSRPTRQIISSPKEVIGARKKYLSPLGIASVPESLQQSATGSIGSPSMASIRRTTIKNEPSSGTPLSAMQAPSTTPNPPGLSYSSMNNAKKKKDDGKDFMRTKVKYFDDWSRRMKRTPLPPRPKGADGHYTISPYKQKSAAVKALSSKDDKSLIAFIVTKEKALKAVEQAGSADPAMYDDNGMLVVETRKKAQPKKRSYKELLGEEEQGGAE
jgi:hypothetical protein